MTLYTVVYGHHNRPVSRVYRRRRAAFALADRLNAAHATRTYPYAVLIEWRDA